MLSQQSILGKCILMFWMLPRECFRRYRKYSRAEGPNVSEAKVSLKDTIGYNEVDLTFSAVDY